MDLFNGLKKLRAFDLAGTNNYKESHLIKGFVIPQLGKQQKFPCAKRGGKRAHNPEIEKYKVGFILAKSFCILPLQIRLTPGRTLPATPSGTMPTPLFRQATGVNHGHMRTSSTPSEIENLESGHTLTLCLFQVCPNVHFGINIAVFQNLRCSDPSVNMFTT